MNSMFQGIVNSINHTVSIQSQEIFACRFMFHSLCFVVLICRVQQIKVDEVPKLKETVQNLQAKCQILQRNHDQVLLDLQYWRDRRVSMDVVNLRETVGDMTKKNSHLERQLSKMASDLAENRAQISKANQALRAKEQQLAKLTTDLAAFDRELLCKTIKADNTQDGIDSPHTDKGPADEELITELPGQETVFVW
jgi:chromosome segregation ATPase